MSKQTDHQTQRSRKKRRRNCLDRSHFDRLTDLRRWRHRVYSATNPGIKRRLISSRPEIEYLSWDIGWTTYLRIRLDDGYEISMSSSKIGGLKWNPGYEESAAAELYRVLSRRLRGKPYE